MAQHQETSAMNQDNSLLNIILVPEACRLYELKLDGIGSCLIFKIWISNIITFFQARRNK